MATKSKGGSEAKNSENSKSQSGDIYGKFLDFLKSPMWALPVMSFVEQRSIVFDREQGEEKLYKQIHGEYASMVDMLIQCFCEDIGVKPEQVAEALKKDRSREKTKVETSMLEPVAAAQDYNLFVHMMMRKNIELQLQALQMIEVMCGLIPAVLLPGGPEDAGQGGEEQERIILIQIMKQSKEEYEKEQNRREHVRAEANDAMRASLAEKDRLEAEKRKEEALVHAALKLSLNDPEKDSSKSSTKARALSVSGEAGAQASSTHPTSAKSRGRSSVSAAGSGEEALISSAPAGGKTASDIRSMKDKGGAEQDDLQKRQEYLRQQRDKLLNMKREARLKAFAEAENDGKQKRPKTAKAAKVAMRGGRGEQPAPKISDDVLAARKALAQKLKQEVMGL